MTAAVENEWFDVRSLPAHDLIPRDLRLLSQAPRTATSRVDWDPDGRRIRFWGLAGMVSLGGGVVPVRPKFASGPDWLAALLRAAALLGPSRARRAFSLMPGRLPTGYLSPEFVDLVAWVFATDLMEALRDGPLMVYRRTVQERVALRGRLLAHKHITGLPHRRHRIPCSFTEMSADNEHLRLLSWSAHELMRRCRLSSVRHALSQVIELLPPPQVDPSSVDTLMPLPPGAQHYAIPMSISRELARLRSVSTPDETRRAANGPRKISSLLIDMASFFEGLVSALYSGIAQERGWSHSTQAKTVFATRRGVGEGYKQRLLRPDDIICPAGEQGVPLVSDSKYHGRTGDENDRSGDSRLGPGVFYQLTSSMLARSADCGLLVQPRIDSLPRQVPDLEEWYVSSGLLQRDLRIVIVRLDLRLIQDPRGLVLLRGRLSEGLDAALEFVQ